MTGQAAALLADRYLAAGSGVFALTGHDAADSLVLIVALPLLPGVFDS